MRIEFNLTKEKRRELVKAISEILKTKPRYMGMPSAGYDFGGLIVDRFGTLEFEENIFPKDIDNLLKKLAKRGFTSKGNEVIREMKESSQSDNMGLTVEIPKDKVDLAKLKKILGNKGDLIKKAIGISELQIEEDDEKVIFPWFESIDKEHLMTYTKFIAALCKMSKEQKRINCTEKEVKNEKYAFRCFLLRLGFIGDEYKIDRKILLSNLSGSSAFRLGVDK